MSHDVWVLKSHLPHTNLTLGHLLWCFGSLRTKTCVSGFNVSVCRWMWIYLGCDKLTIVCLCLFPIPCSFPPVLLLLQLNVHSTSCSSAGSGEYLIGEWAGHLCRGGLFAAPVIAGPKPPSSPLTPFDFDLLISFLKLYLLLCILSLLMTDSPTFNQPNVNDDNGPSARHWLTISHWAY